MPRYQQDTARPSSRAGRTLAAAMGLATLALAAQPAQATTITDTSSDILPTFSGPQTGPASGPFDITSVSAIQDGGAVEITTTMAGPATAAAYVIGINRGAGTALFNQGPVPIGAGVNFDAVAVLIPGGPAFVQLIGSSTMTPLSEVTFSGDTVSAIIPLADFPSTGFTPANYLYNVWPRNGLNAADNTQISEFDPPTMDFAASAVAAVPEPSAWALMLLGVGALGAALRSRRLPTASPTPA
jgi:hypothetical protein